MLFNEKDINYSAPDLMCVCVDGSQNSDINGRIYNKEEEDPMLFSSAAQMIRKMDALCDRLGYPRASVKFRTFKRSAPRARSGEDAVPMKKGENILENRGQEATFVVHIKYRQNATWQGNVTWAETKKSSNFRSALELLKLIDSALGEEENNEERN